MPCSCGNTNCPCGIPCYCSEESCKCHDCAIALSRFCKICDKPLFTERPIDEDTCSCFMGESTALILENPGNSKFRLGNIPMPIGYFVPAKLVVNVMIPVPVLSIPYFIPQKPFCLMPPIPSMGANHGKVSLISDHDVVKPIYLPEKIDFTSTEESHILSKSNEQSNDYDFGCSSNCEQNADISCEKLCPPPEFLQSTNNRQTVNVVQNTKSVTDEYANIQGITSFYLPSVVINDVSYPVRMMDPIWRLPNSAVCFAGGPDSTLNLLNPFYVAGPVHTFQAMATCDNLFGSPAPRPTFEANGTQYFTDNKDRNVQAESVMTLQMNEQILDLTTTSEQSNLVINGKNVEFATSSNNAMEKECTALPNVENSDAIAASEANCLMSAQLQSSCITSTFVSRKNYSLQAFPDTCNPTNQISDNVCPESTCEVWQKVDVCSSFPVLTDPNPQILKGNSGTFQTSKLPVYLKNDIQSFQENAYLQKGNSCSVSANDIENKENLPLYIDPYTTKKMEKFLKPTLKLNASSPTLIRNAL